VKLLLIRHAIAEERGSRWPDDSLRPLTLAGERKMREVAAGIARLARPGLILTSPYVRARQTAEIVAAAFPGVAIEAVAALASGSHTEWFARAAAAGVECVAAVGHEPMMSETLSLLCTGDEQALRIAFKKGGAALVECAGPPGPGTATLLWFIPPAGLRAIGASSAD
jgi:phosphohistidine phosphatase